MNLFHPALYRENSTTPIDSFKFFPPSMPADEAAQKVLNIGVSKCNRICFNNYEQLS